MKIGYLGPDGTFSQQAALLYQESLTQESVLLQYNNIYAALEGVMKCEIEECVVPLENSIEGTVTSTIDFLIFTSDIYIIQELMRTWTFHGVFVSKKSIIMTMSKVKGGVYYQERNSCSCESLNDY